MSSHAVRSARSAIPFARLPWLLAGGFLALYLVMLSRGTGVVGVAWISKVTGWDWQPFVQFPLYYLLTLPVRLLPEAIQPSTLNVLSAVLAAGTLGLVARSVQLLPQDRTRDQRERERGAHGVLTGPAAWLPAVTATAMCGLQLLFWQNATNASVDTLNLFVLAWLIRELLEFRVDGRESRMTRFAFIYGLGVTSNAALIALFPIALGAVIWVMGLKFFRSPLILKLFTAGVAGLLLYLLLPTIVVGGPETGLTWWAALKANLGFQKAILATGFSNRLFPAVMGLGSLFPLILIGVRWPGSFGDTSAAGNFLTRMMFRLMVFIFIAASVVMNLHLKHVTTARAETGFDFHSLFLLSAIVLGYSIGYLLVVFGKSSAKHHQTPGALGALLNRIVVGFAWLLLPAVAFALVKQNAQKVRDLNVSPLYDYAAAVAQQLAAKPALVLSDDPTLLALVADRLSRTGAKDHLLVHTRSLSAPAYHAQLARRSGGAWPQPDPQYVIDHKVADSYMVKTVADLATNRPVIYLHPSFGYYFEWFHPVEDRHLFQLHRYTNNSVQVPELATAAMQAHTQFLQSWWDESLSPVNEKLKSGRASLADGYFAQLQSSALNSWGVRLQHANLFAEAGPWFERATQMFSNNVSAAINLEFNRHHRAGGTNVFKLSDATVSLWKNYRDNLQAALSLGGPIDEPGFAMGIGQVFAAGNLSRQAAQSLLRALALTPNNQYARVQLARTFLQAQAPDRAIAVLREIRERSGPGELNEYAQIDLADLEARALLAQDKTDQAVALLDGVAKRYPEQPAVFEVISQLYLGMATVKPDFVAHAEAAVKRHLALSPTNLIARYNAGTVSFLKQDWPGAVANYSAVLQQDPGMQNALMNRAIANFRAGNYAPALEDYQQLEKKNPDLFQVHYGLGYIAEKQGRAADALKHLNRYLELAPKGLPEYTNVLDQVEKLKGR